MADTSSEYRVLARKYRPSTFDDLVGQEPMVRTLTNAFATGRIAQAYMLTGVRGVGKTTTARILARGLNYETQAGDGQATVDLSEPGIHCEAIMAGHHPDVIEMDAASHTGIDDIREIIAGVRYRPTSARYKVYIVDEVHMLSKSAFNALLKTLEEPPEHVKFIFATTEIRKVPITVLSRCQRFDLRRIGSGELMALLGDIASKEGVEVEDGALAAIARAGEGSARDALSLFDQAIAHAAGTGSGVVEADGVRAMLGLADRARVIDLFAMLMRGDIQAALAELLAQYETGADPATVLSDLAQFVHFVTRLKFVEAAAKDPALSEEERTRGQAFAAELDVRILGRTWQMLLKGIAEVNEAARPLSAADMVLIRIAHAADLPTLDAVMKQVAAESEGGDAPATIGKVGSSPATNGATAVAQATTAAPTQGPRMQAAGGNVVALRQPEPERQQEPEPAPAPAPAPVLRLVSFEAMLREAERRRDPKFVSLLKKHVDPVEWQVNEDGSGRFSFRPVGEAPVDLANIISGRLRDWTDRTWPVIPTEAEGTGTVRERERARHETMMDEALADPIVQAALSAFPGARIVDVRAPAKDEELLDDLPVEPDVALSTGEADELEHLDDGDPGAADLDDYFN